MRNDYLGPYKIEGQRGRILMLSLHGYVAAEPEFGLPDTGGQVVFVLELARRFAAAGFEVDIVTRRFANQPETDHISEGLRIWRIPFGGREFIRKEDMHDHLDEFVSRFTAAVQDSGITYQWVGSHYWDAGYAGGRIAANLDLPHVHTPHSLGSWKRANTPGDPEELERLYRFGERILTETETLQRADAVVATSRYQSRLIINDYGVPADRIFTIPPGIDEERYSPVTAQESLALRDRFGFGPYDVYSVGRAADNKGYDLLIRTLPELRRQIPDARLQLAVGAGSEADDERISQWKALAAELGVAEHVNWLGHIGDDEMADYYRAAPVFALPSRYEPFGMTAAEAMACGTPTVVTIHGGLEESLDFGRHALIADPERPREYAVVLSLPLRYRRIRERLSSEGASFARSEFGWDSVAARTLKVFRLAEPNRRELVNSS